ncbi:mitochondrial carrier [Dissoconium aciculare CBS 342.82]|uniref:Mitochondrial carrier n=1 Tax=Dissoconium aciculare CBS 342.82 TaxID=1314786 RepID=A0A6J3M0I6_9PEZI|nr:mitochondrial carrier [Dissoconium aciculare CBS 342.82]KAF1820412.1 mitochondrial carrier [Dissoconium aciculare CBS 342.82]
MSSTNSDTHDHGPPTTTTNTTTTTTLTNLDPNSLTNRASSFPRIAKWSTSWSPAAVNSFSGAMAGMASGIVTCPLDVIKTKLQAQGSFRARSVLAEGVRPAAMYQGMLGTARIIYTQDGLRGMYRGLGPMLLGYLPTWAVYMSVYDSSREYWYTHGYGEQDRDKWLARVYASLTAGACSTLATNPIWVIKTRLMSQVSRTASKEARTPWHYANTFDAARKMYRAEGIGAFYSGLAPALLGLTHVAIQFPLYEYFKQQFTGVEMGATPDKKGEAGKNTLGILAATFLSKVCATSATYPHEVVRTRLQTQQRHWRPHYRGVLDTCRTILREEGWRAFYNGMGTNMIRAVPAAMTTMLTYESIKGWIGRLQEEGQALTDAETDGGRI